MTEGTVFNIQRFSVHDGPGIRTTVFLKGCPLRCKWCHNPESNEPVPQLAYYEQLCNGCGSCAAACKEKAVNLKGVKVKMNRQLCTTCGGCVSVCLFGAREILGRTYLVEQVMKEVEKDRAFYKNSGGGITVSGGEPLYQAGFTASILRECKREEYHTAVETCGFASEDVIKETAEYTDLFLYDIKLMDSRLHRKYTGVGNEQIHKNLKIIGRELKKDIWIRMPLIKNINDSEEEMKQAIDMVSDIKPQIKKVCLLPYHALGLSKLQAIGADDKEAKSFEAPVKIRLERLKELWIENGYYAVID